MKKNFVNDIVSLVPRDFLDIPGEFRGWSEIDDLPGWMPGEMMDYFHYLCEEGRWGELMKTCRAVAAVMDPRQCFGDFGALETIHKLAFGQLLFDIEGEGL